MSLPLRSSAGHPAPGHPAPGHRASDQRSLRRTERFRAPNPAPLTLHAEDGVPLAATRWLAGGEPRGVVLIAPATGVPRRFYLPFAEFLVSQGFDVLTWDWRGIAESRSVHGPRDPRLTMRAWGEQDLAAAIAWGRRHARDGRLAVVGHSFGGQALGLAPNAGQVDRAVFVGAQHGYMGHWPWRLRLPLALLWRVAMPAAAAVLGRFPSRRLGFGEDLPAGVAREWARWCARPAHLGTWAGHAALAVPILAFSFADDAFAPRRAAAALLDRYARARVRHEHLPAAGLGHFGFFRAGRAAECWAQVSAFLQADD